MANGEDEQAFNREGEQDNWHQPSKGPGDEIGSNLEINYDHPEVKALLADNPNMSVEEAITYIKGKKASESVNQA